MSISLVGATLHVTDVERSLEFYRKLPDAAVIFHMAGRFALLRIGTGRLGLLADQKRAFHLEVDCEDLDTTYAKLQELGVKTEGPPTDRPWGERDLWVLDPDGNLVEFGQQRKKS